MSAEAGWELLLLKPVWTSRHARPLIENSVIHPNKRVSLRPAEGGLPSACRAVWPENTSKLLAGGRRKTPQSSSGICFRGPAAIACGDLNRRPAVLYQRPRLLTHFGISKSRKL